MEPENRQMWDDVSPTLKAKLLKVLELKKLPLDQLAFVLIVLDTSQTFTSVGDLVNYYEKKNQTLSLEKWKFIFKKLQLSKEFEDLVAVHQREMMDEVNLESSLPAETALPGTFCSSDLNEQTNFSSQDKQFVLVNDSSSSSLVADARACEYQGAIPKRKQAQHPNSPVTEMEPENRQMCDDISPTLKAKLLKVLELKKLPLDQLAFVLIVLDTSRTFTSVGDLVNYYEKKNQTLSLEKWKFIFKKLQLSKEFEDLVAQDSGFFSEEGNSHPQMASLSTALMDTPASGHEGVQHQNSASSIVLEGGKTEHQIQSMMSRSDDSRRQLDHFKLTRTRPNTPEGAQPGSNSPSLVTGRHNNRPNQYDSVEVDGVSENGEKSDRAVEQYDSTENNGFVDETKQLRRLLEDQEQLINAILEENRRLCLLMAVLRCEVRRADDVACGGSGAVVELNHASDSNDIQRLEGEHRQEMERMREEHRQDIQRLEGEHRQEMERMREEHRQARQAGDVASQGSSAAVKDEYMSDSSDELEPGADEQIGPSPYLFESDPEDFTDDEFFDAVDH